MTALRAFDALGVPLDRLCLVEASAGTGKTYAIAGLYLRLVVEAGLHVDRILVVTFTEAATHELRGRIRARLAAARAAFAGEAGAGDDAVLAGLLDACDDRVRAARRLEAAVLGFDEAAIFTIHGFCSRVLGEHAFAAGQPFAAETLADADALLAEVVEDFWRLRLHAATPTFVGQVLAARLSPRALLAEVRPYLGRPGLERIAPAATDPDAADAAFAAAFAAAREAWPAAREAVAGLLLESPALNRNAYRKPSVARWIAALDAYLAAAPDVAGFAELDRFTPARLAQATGRGKATPEHPFFAACARLHAAAATARELHAAALARLRLELLDYAERELAARKRRERLQSYDDLLSGLAAALAAPGAGARLAANLRSRYVAALIDEFQDTDPTQYAIFRAIYAGHAQPVFMVGDPKQAIYSFRGADVFAYLRARADAPERYTLATNWRSRPALVAAVNALFARRADPFVLPGIAFQPVAAAPRPPAECTLPDGPADAALQLWLLPAGEDGRPLAKERAGGLAATACARRIARLLGAPAARLDGRALNGGDIAVLVRSHRQAGLIRDALAAVGVPAVLQSRESVFASAEAEALERVLLAVHEPRREARVRAALITPLFGVDAAGLLALDADPAAWERLLDAFHRYHALWRERGFSAMLRALLAGHAVERRLLALADGERRLTNLLHLAELAAAAESAERLAPAALLRWLAAHREAPGGDDDDRQLRLESDAERVKIVTIHKSKGLEYPVVFCPFLWDGRVHARQAPAIRYHHAGHGVVEFGAAADAPGRALAEREEHAENLRLAYVALTRARHRCYVAWGAVKEAESSPLAWLLHPQGMGEAPGVLPRGELDALAAASGGAIAVLDWPDEPPAHYRAAAETRATLAARPFSRPLAPGWRLTSFSQLVQGLAHEGPDHDAAAPLSPADMAVEAPSDFRAFPRGARAGTCLHAIFEALDFAAADREAIAAEAARQLARHDFAPHWRDAVAAGIHDVLHTPLDATGLRLAEVPAARRQVELEFVYPLAGLSVAGLARVLGAHGVMLPGLAFDALGGYLRGFVDLVFEARGRVYVVDYKSNWLGPEPDDYRAERLPAAMDAAGYRLQYLVYTVAVHRWLRLKRPGYAYARDFGGVFYLFLRGMSPALGPGHGVFADRPAPALVEALDHYLEHGDAGTRQT